ncbi:MAG: aldolase/citrate lyase family protein [Betaproteobacteria bacterium]
MYKLLENIRAGRVSHGLMGKGGPNLVQHLASAGHEFLIVDMMHSNVDWTELSHMAWKARAEGLYPLVRLPANPWGSGASLTDRRFSVDAERAFGSGAEGLIWSIASVEEARIMAHMGRDSHQGAPVTSAQELQAATEYSNNTRLLLPLIESIGALEALDEILDIDGISGVFIGCTDLAEVLGHPLDYLNPEVLAAVERACKSAKKRGKIVLANTGYAFPSIEGQVAHAKALKKCGVNMLMLQTVEFNLFVIAKSVSDAVRAA